MGTFQKKAVIFPKSAAFDKEVPWLVKLIFGLSEQIPGFEPSPVRVTSVVDKEA